MRSSLLLVVALLLAPAASAAWSAHGAWEPDHEPDALQGLMWRDPDWSDAGARVYFNAYLSQAGGAGVNPNMGLLQGRVLPPEYTANAMLGVWKDCNHDGYIGAAESAVMEYREELLALEPLLGNPTTCTATNGHVRDGWVYEFRWIGHKANVFDPSMAARHMIDDAEARVWADAGLPGQVDYTQQTGPCSANPPQGGLSSTGGLLGWLDCNTGYAVISASQGVDRETGLGLGFSDAPTAPACSQSPLNVGVQLFASDPRCDSGKPGLLGHRADEERPLVVATDCETPAAPSQPVDDPTTDGQRRVEVSEPASGQRVVAVNVTDASGAFAHTPVVPGAASAPGVDADGSAFDAADRASRDADGCDGAGLTYISPETTLSTAEPAKRNPDLTLTFVQYDGHAIPLAFGGLSFLVTNPLLDAFDPVVDLFAPGATDEVPRSTTDLVAPLGSAPPNGGLGAPIGFFGLGLAPTWTTAISNAGAQTLVRDDLAPAERAYYTFYAYVGASTISTGVQLPPSQPRLYGDEWCQGASTGLMKGFDCDKTNWWDTSKGAADESIVAREVWAGRNVGVRAHQPYQLRDIDCYDGSLTGAFPGVGLGLTSLSSGPCP